MGFEGNVAPSVLSPGMYLKLDLATGARSASAQMKCLLIAPKGSGGTITEDTELVEAAAGAEAVGLLLDPGTPGHLAAKAVFREYPLARVDVICPTAPSGDAATGTVTFDDTTPVTVAQTVTGRICGRVITHTWDAGVTDTAEAALWAAEVNKLDDDLPIVASAVGAVVTYTAKIDGTWGNDIAYSVALSEGTGGAATAGGTKCTGGTTEYNCTTALGLVTTLEYDLILVVTGNTDAALTSSSNPLRVKTHIDTYYEGFNALLQQGVYAHTAVLSTFKTGVAAMNSWKMQAVYARGLLSLPCELAGAEVGARMREESKDMNVNRVNRADMPYRAVLYVSRTLTTDRLTDVELEDALQSGISPIKYTPAPQSLPYVAIPRTTYFKDSSGNPDSRIVYVSIPTSFHGMGKAIRSYLPERFRESKVVPVLPQNREKVPAMVVDAATVQAVAVAYIRTEFCQKRSVANEVELDAAVAAEEFVANVDPVASDKINLLMPISIIPPLRLIDAQFIQRRT
jgi:phage tail sheath gpL-like